MDKKYYLVIIAVILIIIFIAIGVFAQESYTLTCGNAETFKQFYGCINFNNAING